MKHGVTHAGMRHQYLTVFCPLAKVHHQENQIPRVFFEFSGQSSSSFCGFHPHDLINGHQRPG
jgi:hypothetical protein